MSDRFSTFLTKAAAYHVLRPLSIKITDIIHEVELKPYMDWASDTHAGVQHRCTAAMRHFRAEVMKCCQEAGLYQIDLLGGSKKCVTERE